MSTGLPPFHAVKAMAMNNMPRKSGIPIIQGVCLSLALNGFLSMIMPDIGVNTAFRMFITVIAVPVRAVLKWQMSVRKKFWKFLKNSYISSYPTLPTEYTTIQAVLAAPPRLFSSTLSLLFIFVLHICMTG